MGASTKIEWTDQPPSERRAVVGFPGYEVSDRGQVFGLNGRALRPGGSPRPIVVLYRGGTPHARQVCRIVLEAFVGPPPFDGACALHKDDDPRNNHVTNLRWGTRKENKQDERHNRGRVSGKAPRLAAVSDADLHRGSARDVAKRHGTSHSVVMRERRRRG
jgi:hypothetical protein